MAKQPTKEEIVRRQKKTVSVKKLAEQIRGLRHKVTQDMKSSDEKDRLTAAAVAIMDCTAERVGNDSSAGSGHVGVTGFKKRHVKIEGNKVFLSYTGKSGVKHEKEFTDERIAKVLKECLKRAKSDNDFVFTTSDGYKVKADRVNRYLKDYGVTAKDIRGYSANHMAVTSLRNRKIPNEESERKKVLLEVLGRVAEEVGHGRATLRKHYLLPNIEDMYVKKGKIPSIKEASLRSAAMRVANYFYISRLTRGSQISTEELNDLLQDAVDKVEKSHKKLFNEETNMPETIILEVTDDLPEGKIGSYAYDKDGEKGKMKVGLKAFERGIKMVYYVIAHELVHASIGPESDKHGERFQQLSDALGIPKWYQD
jgi:hypothetical protein